MRWRVELTGKAQKQFAKLDSVTQQSLVHFMTRLETLEDPTQLGAMLAGTLAGLWRYRVGKYRLLCELRKNVLLVEVIEIGKRDTIYR